MKAVKKITEQNALPFCLLLPPSFVYETRTVCLLFVIKPHCSYLMKTSVAPSSAFEVHEKLGILQKLLSSTAFFFFPKIIKLDKFSG